MNLSQPIFLKALNKEILDTPPIWYMRQAGRYMPEYQAVRKNYKNFLDMCKDPDLSLIHISEPTRLGMI